MPPQPPAPTTSHPPTTTTTTTTHPPRWVSTGLDGLDAILDGLRIGDNVVWTVDHTRDYRYFVEPYLQAARRDGRDIIYFRFGQEPPLVGDDPAITRYDLNAHHGFETFSGSVHAHIRHHGVGAFYLFDCLSDLLLAWATDQMVGNFFQVTCPYLFRLDTLAYFGVLRTHHSFRTIAWIRQITQVMIGVYSRDDHRHVHPIKVWERYSPTMFLPHEMRGDAFLPIANSYDATTLLSEIRQLSVANPRRRLDYWDRLFLDAEDIVAAGPEHPEYAVMVDTLCRVMISQDPRMLALARRYLSLRDLLSIKSRMIGTGFIGGKAVGMLIARGILHDDASFNWGEILEPHDSFHIGSDAFYWFIVHNGWWELLMRQRTPEGYYEAGQALEQQMLTGRFPERLMDALWQMLEYFGQYPLIVRSSSLLEDGFSGAFAGKYESCFCVNQGSPETRMEQLAQAIRRIFASAMSQDALSYRRQRGLEAREEPMGLLVQRVSGAYRGHYYMPDIAGVGVSYNTFVWSHDMDPRAGMLRLVMGLGTRAVDRVEGDYPCTTALDQPMRRPYRDQNDALRFSQRQVDTLDLETGELRAIDLTDLVRAAATPPLEYFAVRDRDTEQRLRDLNYPHEQRWLLSFEPLLAHTGFAGLMQRLLKTIEKAYDYPVDIEFTMNFDVTGRQHLNLVQCRPLQTRGADQRVQLPESVADHDLLFRTHGSFMGGSVQLRIDEVIWVEPARYARATMEERHEVARLVGRLNRALDATQPRPSTLLIGPGRWGTSTPELGVPVRFSEINHMAALVEVASIEAGIVPELSYGTHFFQDLVETGTFYAALAIDQSDCALHPTFLDACPNRLLELLPDATAYAGMIKVASTATRGLTLFSDVVRQEAICCATANT